MGYRDPGGDEEAIPIKRKHPFRVKYDLYLNNQPGFFREIFWTIPFQGKQGFIRYVLVTATNKFTKLQSYAKVKYFLSGQHVMYTLLGN